MGDYVLKMCKFIPLYFKMLICNIPAKKSSSSAAMYINPITLLWTYFKLLPQTKQ